MEYKDYYKILGVDKTASQDEIKKAYRKLARKYHPDVSKEANAENKFKDVNEANEVLKDKEKRKAYDQLGSGYQQGQGFEPPPGWDFQEQAGGGQHGTHHFHDGADFSDFFEQMFRGARQSGDGPHVHGFRQSQQPRRQKGQDIHATLQVTIHDAYHGTKREVALRETNGETKRLNIKIPAGVTNGQHIRLKGQGNPGFNGGANGDLLLEIKFMTDSQYKIDGKDVYLTLPIAPWEAALGASIQVPTLGGKISLKIPANSESGKKMRLKGRGLPGKTPGDQYVVLQIVVPPAKTDADKKLYEQMQSQMDFNPRDKLNY